MGWLFGPVLASWGIAYAAVRIFDYAFGEASNGVAHMARPGVFVGAWTAVTAATGMRGFSKRIRGLRQIIGMRKMP